MIAIGLVGIAGVAVMTLTESSNKEAKWGEMAFVKSEFVNSFGKYITSFRGCADLVYVNFNSPKNIVVNWKVAGIEGNPNLKMEVGRKFKFFNVTELSAEPTSLIGSQVTVDGVLGNKRTLKVKLTLQVKSNLNRSDPNAPNRNYSYEYNVPVILDSTNKVIGCFESESLQASCEALGGLIDSNTGLCEQKGMCNFVGSCFEPMPENSTLNPGLPPCSSFPCPGGQLIVTGGRSIPGIPIPSGCGGKTPCGSRTDIDYLVKSCMVCEPQIGTSGGGGGGTVTGGSGGFGGFFGGGGGGGFGSGSGSF